MSDIGERLTSIGWRGDLPRGTLGALAVAGASIGVLYLVPSLAAGATVAAALALLAAARPVALVAAIPALLPLTYEPLRLGGARVSPPEFALIAACAGVAIRAGVCLAASRAASLRRAGPRARDLLSGGLGPAMLAFLAVGTLSLATVADPSHRHESLREFRWVVLEPVVYAALARWYLASAQARRLAVSLFAAGGALEGGYALARLATGHGLVVEGVVRISGTFPHPNALALYLDRPVALAAVVALAFVPRARLAWLVAAALAGLALLLTFSRGALLAVAIALPVGLVLGRRRRLAGAAVAAEAVGGIALVALASARIGSLFGGGSGSARLSIWRSALAMIRDHPVFGVGLDQFLYQYAPRYVRPEAWPERFTSHPHDLVLDLWLRLGIMGVVVGAVLATLLVRMARRAVAAGSTLGLGAACALLAGAIHGLVDNGYFLPDLALTFWFLAVVLEGEATGARATGPKEQDGIGEVGGADSRGGWRRIHRVSPL